MGQISINSNTSLTYISFKPSFLFSFNYIYTPYLSSYPEVLDVTEFKLFIPDDNPVLSKGRSAEHPGDLSFRFPSDILCIFFLTTFQRHEI